MKRIPSPAEVRPMNHLRQQDAKERTSLENAQRALDTITLRLDRDGVPYGGMRYQLPSTMRHDSNAVDIIVRQLRNAGWKVSTDPDDEDDIGHGRTTTSVLLICFP
ncbi:MAG TPA: hypothetical protein VJB64_00165 [Patescibacteria group bacterium]|nr:hypothetical protein [Patescibacteria group bacterium]